jgi:hypothetical protein
MNKRIVVASLVCLLWLYALSFTAWAQSRKRHKTDWQPEMELEIIASVPAFKPDGKPHDARSDFAQATLGAVGAKGVMSFLEAEAAPDLKLLVRARGNGLVRVFDGLNNRYEATFSISEVPGVCVIALIDADGPLGDKRSYHDLLAVLVLSTKPEPLSEKAREKLVKKGHRMLRKIGVHEREHTEQVRFDGGQTPKSFPIFNLRDCLTRKCTFTAFNGVTLRFSLKVKE